MKPPGVGNEVIARRLWPLGTADDTCTGPLAPLLVAGRVEGRAHPVELGGATFGPGRLSKLAAALMSPRPVYAATDGYGNTGRTLSMVGGGCGRAPAAPPRPPRPPPTECDAMIESGATPRSTQLINVTSSGKSNGPSPPLQCATAREEEQPREPRHRRVTHQALHRRVVGHRVERRDVGDRTIRGTGGAFRRLAANVARSGLVAS